MATDTTRMSLFTRLLSNRASRASKEGGYKGHEEYLTQIMVYMLETDLDLAKLWLNEWFRIEGAQNIVIVAEDSSDSASHTDLPTSTIDVLVTCLDSKGTAHRVYVENKVEARLNLYRTSGGEVVDQVEKYTALLERVCAESGEQGNIIVCGLRPQKRRDAALASRVRWHVPKYWWDLAVMVRDHQATSPDAAWVQRAFVAFCEEQGLMPLKALREDTITPEQARRLLGLGALAAKAKSITTTAKVPTGGARYPWTATVYYEPEEPRVAARPKYWISLSKQAEDAPVAARGYWEKVCELRTPFGNDLWALDAEQQRRMVQAAVEDLPRRMDYLEPALALHEGRAGENARSLVERLLASGDLWLVAGKNEIRAARSSWPKGFSIKINFYEGTGSELVVVPPKNDRAFDKMVNTSVITQALGTPTRPVSDDTFFCYDLDRDQEAATVLVGGVGELIDTWLVPEDEE